MPESAVPRRLTKLLTVGFIAFVPSQALAQTTSNLATSPGHELNVSVGAYKYVEPSPVDISIRGPKVGGGYAGTLSISEAKHWFLKAQTRGLFGNTAYDGWCSPILIRPDSRSPNGYALGFGARSTCSESGAQDWYLEGRALVGKDFIRRSWGWSPEIGLGVRHLSNGTTGFPGHRIDDYLYLPVGLTARTLVASRHALSFNVEYDLLLHGWQTTRDSQRGGGTVPATATAPAFTIEGFSDVSFDQHSGWAVRASARYQLTRQWFLEPEYTHWNVDDSTVSEETATFTVNGITARQQIGFYEPLNTTDEFIVKIGFRF